jgi:hypothetical protein
MKTYDHVEDYLEVIAGKRDLAGNASTSPMLFWDAVPIVSLARYDVNFVDSVTDSTMQGRPLTDKQAELACKLILKYRKQLHAKGVDVDPVLIPKYRRTLRMIDRSCSLGLRGDQLELKFPYDVKMIEVIRDFLKQSQGGGVFDKNSKTWLIDRSEFNINYLVSWCRANNFHIDPTVQAWQDGIVAMESQPYAIELARDATGRLTIANAEFSLLEYLQEQNIGFEESDLLRLADMSSVLGYEISNDLRMELDATIGSDMSVLVTAKEYDIHGDTSLVERIYRYAQLVNRLPVVVYFSDPSQDLNMWQRVLGPDVVHVHRGRELPNFDAHQVIITTLPVRDVGRIPMLVSHNGLMLGAEKMMMLQNSEKIIYFNQKLRT